jgi:hypothetical protein
MGIFKRTNIFSMTPREVQQTIEKTGATAAEAASYVAGNKTEAIQTITNGVIDTSRGVVTAQSGQRAGTSIFKGAKDYARGDILCTGLCAVSTVCESTSMVIVWIPMPVGKICTLGLLKGVSYGCMKIRDLCAAEPGNPIC